MDIHGAIVYSYVAQNAHKRVARISGGGYAREDSPSFPYSSTIMPFCPVLRPTLIAIRAIGLRGLRHSRTSLQRLRVKYDMETCYTVPKVQISFGKSYPAHCHNFVELLTTL